jgi:hypothetical protein
MIIPWFLADVMRTTIYERRQLRAWLEQEGKDL